ncbi:MAG: DegT/DnrJ/EryC1/StrS family aminotransferase [Candidatus Hodarchaeota archaeon]
MNSFKILEERKVIKLFSPYIEKEEINAVSRVLRSGWWTQGTYVREFEREFAKYVEVKHAVAVNSGTSALFLALKYFHPRGWEVLTPSLTFVSPVHSILQLGGKPVFVDVNEETLTVDVEDLKQKLTSRCKIVMPMHFGGYPCDMDAITDLAEDHRFVVLGDCAHACGSTYKDRKLGSLSDVSCFSFHPVKNLSMPNGGAVTTDNAELADFVKLHRNFGRTGSGVGYDVVAEGYNMYLTDVSAAIGLQQLKKLDKMNERRRKIAKIYHENLKEFERMPFNPECCYHLYWIRVKNRDDFIKYMRDHGVEVGLHYVPVHRFTFYKKYSTSLPTTNMVANEIATLPTHCNLTEKELLTITELVSRWK